MKVKVRFFAASRDITGTGEMEIELPEGTTVAHLLEIVYAQYPKLPGITPMVAVNAEYADRNRRLRSGDLVAIIPPVSGG